MSTEELYNKMIEGESKGMRYALKNRSTKEVFIINKTQLAFVRKMFEKKFMLQDEWSIEEIATIESCLDELTEQ